MKPFILERDLPLHLSSILDGFLYEVKEANYTGRGQVMGIEISTRTVNATSPKASIPGTRKGSDSPAPLPITRGVATVDASCEELRRFWAEGRDWARHMKIADPMFIKGRKQLIGDGLYQCYAAFSLPGDVAGVTPRDFTFNELVVARKDGSVAVVCWNQPWEAYPPDTSYFPSYIRGRIILSGYFARPLSKTKSRVAYLVQVDPKGWLPSWVVELVAPNQALNVARLRDHFVMLKKFRPSLSRNETEKKLGPRTEKAYVGAKIEKKMEKEWSFGELEKDAHGDGKEITGLLGFTDKFSGVTSKCKKVVEAFFDALGADFEEPIDNDGVEVSTRSGENGSFPVVKGVGYVHADVKTLKRFWEEEKDWERHMKIMDPMFIEGTKRRIALPTSPMKRNGNIETDTNPEKSHSVQRGLFLCRAAFQLPPTITDREFIFHELVLTLTDGRVAVIAWEAISEEYPESSSFFSTYVRGSLILSGYLAEPVSDGFCRVTYLVHTDPKGWLPPWVVDMVAPNQALNVARLRRHFDAIAETKRRIKQQVTQQQPGGEAGPYRHAQHPVLQHRGEVQDGQIQLAQQQLQQAEESGEEQRQRKQAPSLLLQERQNKGPQPRPPSFPSSSPTMAMAMARMAGTPSARQPEERPNAPEAKRRSVRVTQPSPLGRSPICTPGGNSSSHQSHGKEISEGSRNHGRSPSTSTLVKRPADANGSIPVRHSARQQRNLAADHLSRLDLSDFSATERRRIATFFKVLYANYTEHQSEMGIEIATARLKGSTLPLIRGICKSVQAAPSTLYKFWAEPKGWPEKMKAIDPLFIEGEKEYLCRAGDENGNGRGATFLAYCAFEVPGGGTVTPRDFVIKEMVTTLSNGSVLALAWAAKWDKKYPADTRLFPRRVRGTINISGYLAEPIVVSDEIRASKVTYLVHADPKGMLPSVLVEMIAPTQALNVARLRDYFEDEGGGKENHSGRVNSSNKKAAHEPLSVHDDYDDDNPDFLAKLDALAKGDVADVEIETGMKDVKIEDYLADDSEDKEDENKVEEPTTMLRKLLTELEENDDEDDESGLNL